MLLWRFCNSHRSDMKKWSLGEQDGNSRSDIFQNHPTQQHRCGNQCRSNSNLLKHGAHRNARHAGSRSSNPHNPQCHQARPDGRAKANPLAADVPTLTSCEGSPPTSLGERFRALGPLAIAFIAYHLERISIRTQFTLLLKGSY